MTLFPKWDLTKAHVRKSKTRRPKIAQRPTLLRGKLFETLCQKLQSDLRLKLMCVGVLSYQLFPPKRWD
jgi:hypothetical protein